MAARGSWPSIQKHGLLSTSSLLDLFEVGGARRVQLEENHRPHTEEIVHEKCGRASIRDQKPMSDAGLVRALRDGLSPREWYKILNSQVFFWTSQERLQTLLRARAYANDEHDVLIVDTKPLVEVYANTIFLCPMNSGATTPFAHPRGKDTFLEIGNYPWDTWRKKRGVADAIVEVAVRDGVPNTSKLVLRVQRMKKDKVLKVIFEK